MSPQFIYSQAGGATPPPGPEEFSVNLDGSTEIYATSATTQVVGIGNAWSVSTWFNPSDLSANTGLFSTGRSASTPLIRFFLTGATSTGQLNIQLRSSTSPIKTFVWDGVMSVGTWVNFLATWDGTDLALFIDGVLTAPTTKLVDVSGSMGDFQSRTFYGGLQNFVLHSPGNVGPLGIWGTVLSGSAATEIFDGKFSIDLRNDTGGYAESADLKRYYRPGFDQDVGFSDLVGTMDFSASVDITTDDIEVNFPV